MSVLKPASRSLPLEPGDSAQPPGPKGKGLWGNLADFRTDRLAYLTENARVYGDVVAYRLGPVRIWGLNHPDLIEEVLVHQNRKFQKHFALRAAKPTLGNGLLTSEGDFWRRQRRLSQPAFHRERIAGYGRAMVELTERMLDTWTDGQSKDVQAEMMQLTLEIVARTLFGAEIGGEAERIARTMDSLMDNFTAKVNRRIPLPPWIPCPTNFRFWRDMRTIRGTLQDILTRRRASGEDRGDLLSMLLQATDTEGDGARMTDGQLQDELITLFLAGHETTANTLAWAWWLLSRNPEAEAKVHDELDRVLQGRAPTFEDLPRLTYTDHVITETLRLLPTVWLLGREAMEPVSLGGYTLPKGHTVWMSQWVVHRDPRFYNDPERFLPDRWADGLAKRLPRYAYFPFGGGPRICIGNQFAQMESVLLLAAIARKFRLRIADDFTPILQATMTLRADGGIPAILEARRPATAEMVAPADPGR
jgi:cytochrome P450